jgi:hypothetical protein
MDSEKYKQLQKFYYYTAAVSLIILSFWLGFGFGAEETALIRICSFIIFLFLVGIIELYYLGYSKEDFEFRNGLAHKFAAGEITKKQYFFRYLKTDGKIPPLVLIAIIFLNLSLGEDIVPNNYWGFVLSCSTMFGLTTAPLELRRKAFSKQAGEILMRIFEGFSDVRAVLDALNRTKRQALNELIGTRDALDLFDFFITHGKENSKFIIRVAIIYNLKIEIIKSIIIGVITLLF